MDDRILVIDYFGSPRHLQNRFSFGSVVFDVQFQKKVIRILPDANIRLTEMEVDFLRELIERAGQVLAREKILGFICERQYSRSRVSPTLKSITRCLYKLRQKLKEYNLEGCIRTVPGEGIQFVGLPPEE